MPAIKVVRFIILKDSRFWLSAISAGLIVIHLTLLYRTNSADLLASSFIFWLSVVHLISEQNDTLNLRADAFSSFLGTILISVLLLKSTAITGGHFLQVYPFFVGIGMALLASGFRGLRQYWQELFLLFFLGVPAVILPLLIDISELTARFSTVLLQVAGFDATCEGVIIHLPNGGVEVYSGCSGLQSILQVLGFAVLCLVLVPAHWHWLKNFALCLGAILIAFVVNGVRVALMAYLVAAQQPEAFQYWHVGQGSLFFSIVAVMLFIGLFWWLAQSVLATTHN